MNWTQSLESMCPEITYTFSIYDTGELITDQMQYTWDSTLNELAINTDENYPTGIYKIKTFANVYQINKTEVFYLEITDNCLTANINKQTLQTQYLYELASSQLEIQIQNWTTNSKIQTLCGKVKYSLVNSLDESVVDNQLINFDQDNGKIFVYTINETKVAKYSLKLYGYLQPRNNLKAIEFIEFEIVVVLPTLAFQQTTDCSNAKIKYDPVLPDIYYLIGSTGMQVTKYPLYEWISTIKKCDFNQYKAYYQQVELPIQGVILFNSNQMFFEIDEEDLKQNPIVGKFKIEVQANMGNQKTYSYYFTLTIEKNQTQITQEQTTTLELINFQRTIFQETSETVIIQNKLIHKKDDNYKPEGTLQSQLGIKSWTIQSINGNVMKIKLTWYDPLSISIGMEYDQLEMTFAYPYFFVNKELDQIIKANTVLKAEIPPQLEDSSFMYATAEQASNALTGVVTLNFFLTLVMGLSLKNFYIFGISFDINITNQKGSQGYLNYALAAFIAFETIEDSTTNLISTFIVASIVIISPFLICTFLIQRFQELNDKEFSQKFGTLYLNLNQDKISSIQHWMVCGGFDWDEHCAELVEFSFFDNRSNNLKNQGILKKKETQQTIEF
eukprot:403334544